MMKLEKKNVKKEVIKLYYTIKNTKNNLLLNKY